MKRNRRRRNNLYSTWVLEELLDAVNRIEITVVIMAGIQAATMIGLGVLVYWVCSAR